MPEYFRDAQSAAGFVTPQFYNIERTIYEVKYPSFDYASLVPTITEGNEWARGTLFYSMDSAGQAEWIAGGGFDMPYADVQKSQFTQGFHMAGIGYEWNLEEVNVAASEGINMGDAKARAARRIAQQKLWTIAMTGDPQKNMTGLINSDSLGVPAADVEANGSGSVTFWASKTPDQILADINAGLTGIYTATSETELADTVLLPTAIYQDLASRPRSSTGDTTILSYLLANNVYTAETGRPLMVRGLRVLDDADPGGDGRMVVFRRDPEVLRFHLPMPHRFLPPWQKSSMTWEVAGIMRTGGLEIRLPKAISYLDGIVDTTT